MTLDRYDHIGVCKLRFLEFFIISLGFMYVVVNTHIPFEVWEGSYCFCLINSTVTLH